MLRLLRIRNFALIKELEIEFAPGLNLLTGETGSGKSILVDAFGVLLGSRSSLDMVRTDCEAAIVEGIFELESGDEASRMLAESGLDADEDSLLVRREISSVGKNRILINGHLSTLTLLKSLGENLADIHGQQDQRSLLDLPTHLEWLDYFGENGRLVEEVHSRFKDLESTAKRLESFEADKQQRTRRMEILGFQLDEIHSVDPLPDEMDVLQKESVVLSNSEKILELATDVYATLYESESSVLMGLRRLERVLEELERFDGSWTPNREALKDCLYRIEDIALASRDYAARCDFNPERMEQVQDRLFSLEKLVQKYCPSEKDILAYAEECRRELESLKESADTSADLTQRLESELTQYAALAATLSEKRHRDARRLEQTIKKEFSALAMSGMKLHVRFHAAKDDGPNRFIPGSYGLSGIDRVEFFIAPNEGEDARPLARIASGGELARLMLAIKSLCGKDDVGKTLVFDEVDAGIGGRIAEAVGKRLQSLSRNNQVFCVTHLPQVAVFARKHYCVEKRVLDNRTETIVMPLDAAERVQEISRMLGGELITETTRKHAKEMLEHAGAYGKEGAV